MSKHSLLPYGILTTVFSGVSVVVSSLTLATGILTILKSSKK